MARIGFGTFKIYYSYIFVLVFFKFLIDYIEGFNEKKKYSEDYQLWLTICAKKYLAYYIPYRDVFTFENKAIYGQSGLSSNLWAMEQGELDNYKILRDMKCISLLRYLFAIEYSYLKFIIRKIVVSLRHVLYSKKQLS